MVISPVVLFTFSRLEHTKKTIEALRDNTLSSKTELFIFCDKPKIDALPSVFIDNKNVVDYLLTVSGFKKVTVIIRDRNYGLAENIRNGVGDILKEFGKVIVLEDDIVTSPYFLTFMNQALDKYEQHKKVWHISGWNYPIEDNELKDDVFFWRAMNCWGWATWADRWNKYEKDSNKLIDSWDSKKIKKFNIDGTFDFWSQVEMNKTGKINTWAIFWYATIFNHNGLCLNPKHTYVQNIGNDGSGEHCSSTNIYDSNFQTSTINQWPIEFVENTIAVNEIKFFFLKHKRTFFTRVLSFIIRKLKRNK